MARTHFHLVKRDTRALIDASAAILGTDPPMTVRQCFYRLVATGVLSNLHSEYVRLSKALVTGRLAEWIPWDWIEDRTRVPVIPNTWNGVAAFADTAVQAYQRDVWATQPLYVECWIEKAALAGVFLDVAAPYGMTLAIGKGDDSWSSVYAMAQRFRQHQRDANGHGILLAFSDFDPAGENMIRSLRTRLARVGGHPRIAKVALTAEQVDHYGLPAAPPKAKDLKAKHFTGAGCVELDALPPDVLRILIRNAIETSMDVRALDAVRASERVERDHLRRMLEAPA